jgi:hypothetical protein
MTSSKELKARPAGSEVSFDDERGDDRGHVRRSRHIEECSTNTPLINTHSASQEGCCGSQAARRSSSVPLVQSQYRAPLEIPGQNAIPSHLFGGRGLSVDSPFSRCSTNTKRMTTNHKLPSPPDAIQVELGTQGRLLRRQFRIYRAGAGGTSALMSSPCKSLTVNEVVPGLVELEVAVPRSRPAVW